MKKRFPALLIAVLLILASASAAFADSLTIVDITPADGSKGYQPANMAVKVRFSEDMMDESAIAANKSKFSITDAEGKALEFDALGYSSVTDSRVLSNICCWGVSSKEGFIVLFRR